MSAAFGDSRLPERFWAKVSVNAETGCWEWTASKGVGYGRIHRPGFTSPALAHRWAYEEMVEPVPNELVCDHLCRNRGCVNPDHIEIVTNGENVRRGDSGLHERIKTHCPQGHPYDADNTHLDARTGGRSCRTCRRESNRRRKARLRGEATVGAGG